MNALVVDPERLDTLRSLKPPGAGDLLGAVLAAYADQSRSLIADMAAAIDDSSAERLWHVAADLGSRSAGVGAMRVAALCQDLERVGQSGFLDTARPLFDRLSLALDEANAVLAEIASTEVA